MLFWPVLKRHAAKTTSLGHITTRARAYSEVCAEYFDIVYNAYGYPLPFMSRLIDFSAVPYPSDF